MSTSNKAISRKKSTKRFDFRVRTNPTSHQTGANTVSITPKDYDVSGRGYSFEAIGEDGTVTMSVNEAKALYNFIGKNLVDSPAS
jgi:hypothetical protein